MLEVERCMLDAWTKEMISSILNGNLKLEDEVKQVNVRAECWSSALLDFGHSGARSPWQESLITRSWNEAPRWHRIAKTCSVQREARCIQADHLYR